MGRGVKGKGREKRGRGGKREGPPCSQPPLLKNPGYGPGSENVRTSDAPVASRLRRAVQSLLRPIY